MKLYLKKNGDWVLFEGVTLDAEIEKLKITIHSSAIFGDGARVGEGANVGEWANVGEGAIVGEWASVGKGANVGEWAIVGKGARVGEGANVGEWANVGEGAIVGEWAIVGKGARVGEGARAALAAKAKKRTATKPRKRPSKNERRFLALVKREVEDTITDSELVELDRLEVKRADLGLR
jgi:acyl-[acyl carrier protein]--UDP-N-acetylglucosamine O-acyltransferase